MVDMGVAVPILFIFIQIQFADPKLFDRARKGE